MKPSFDFKKGKEALNNALQKTADASKKVAVGVKDGTKTLVEKAKVDGYERRMKKYNPLFLETYKNDDFSIPNMIIIVDDVIRRDIDVCEGAIGWLDSDNDIEVMYLYDEAIDISGVSFVPYPELGAAYYVDSFDKSRYNRLDCIFGKAHEERLAELKNIAYLLGAKKCIVEIKESKKELLSTYKGMGVGLNMSLFGKNIKNNEGAQFENSTKSEIELEGKIEAEFSGSDIPKRPKLKWFAHDDNVKKLIDMRIKNTNSIKSETLIIKGATCSVMSQKTAYAIDTVISKANIKGHTSMEAKAKKEHSSELIYKVEF